MVTKYTYKFYYYNMIIGLNEVWFWSIIGLLFQIFLGSIYFDNNLHYYANW